MKLLAVTLLAAAILTACGGPANNSANKVAEIKKGVQPVADNEIAVIELENAAAYGTIKIELYSNIAPKMVERFKELAKAGYYDGIIFHRVNGMVIQAGNSDTKPGATPKSTGREGDSGKPNVPAEFSDVLYDTGIVGAARLGNNINSANSQFFVTLRRMPDFDQNYTIFGKVVEGMNNVRTIAGVPKNGERPVDPVRIKTIRIEPKQ